MLSTSASSVSYRQKGKLPSANSKLYKGFVHDATSKLSVGSIPAKLELIIYRDQSTKAFGSSEPRFKQQLPDNPGPQEYDCGLYQVGKVQSESISNKGTGGLACSQERNVFAPKYVNSGPGPGQYNSNNSFNSSQSTNNPSFFMRQQQQKSVEKVEVINPGPGEYDMPQPKKSNVVKYVFSSKTLRGQFQNKPDNPPPGQYEVQNQLSKPEHKGPTSSFYPDGAQLREITPQQQIVAMMLNDKDKQNDRILPGPGDYEVKFPVFDPDYIVKKELSSFAIQPGKDRFGKQEREQEPEKIGPGSYQLPSKFDEIAKDKLLVSGNVFMSESLRQPYGDFEKKLGPNPKSPYILPKKKNFHFNLQRKWV
ncbi:unnamed protein product [Paramecium primaurelia]|uniref:Sperm-tail PG-rich repeat-containing protein 2 n=1 Tax=Paramecium primaurelia TaxID=5886 RepID=A0A8S1LGT4_PARPR|nr:unnamed protein product [Paramecium primaurelia]